MTATSAGPVADTQNVQSATDRDLFEALASWLRGHSFRGLHPVGVHSVLHHQGMLICFTDGAALRWVLYRDGQHAQFVEPGPTGFLCEGGARLAYPLRYADLEPALSDSSGTGPAPGDRHGSRVGDLRASAA